MKCAAYNHLGLGFSLFWLLIPAPFVVGQHQRPALPSPAKLAKLPADGGEGYNRLVFESSPYLLQHAANPVDWYPWGEAAFARARELDRPILLSIGYATCHWCHVMERESFEDEEVAALLNKSFVAIKVDREERPDIDEIYMTACQVMTGAGGWPLTLFLTHDKQAFFAGTYFPKKQKYGRTGMMELLPLVAKHWQTNRQQILTQAERLTTAIRTASVSEPGTLPENLTALTYTAMAQRYEPTYGGFAQKPKFPVPHNLSFLLRYWKRNGDEKALTMVRHTLTQMSRGGIYDHVGFGFHRYSTDSRWLVPHFEKMLYDQALLLMAYCEGFQATGEDDFARIARQIATYVLRDLTAPEGAFYCAEDADSEGEEGKFYLWTRAQVVEILGEADAERYAKVYGLTAEGNFSEPGQPRQGQNILHLSGAIDDLATQMKTSPASLRASLEGMREKLFAMREKRVRPFLDDKILAGWNGLMIAALAQAGSVLDEPRYVAAASKAADFVLARMRRPDGRLYKRYRAGNAGVTAHLEDSAYLTWGLLNLYEAGFEVRYLKAAIELTTDALNYHWDDERGGFFTTAADAEVLLVRSKEIYDGAVPSGNSVAALNLIRLARFTGEETFSEKVRALFQAFAGEIGRRPGLSNQLMCAVDFYRGPAHEIVIVGRRDDPGTRAMLRALATTFLPNKVLLLRPPGKAPDLVAVAPFIAAHRTVDGKATAYVCHDFVCKAPVTSVSELLLLLAGDKGSAGGTKDK